MLGFNESVLTEGHYNGWYYDDSTGIGPDTPAGFERARGTFRRLWSLPDTRPGAPPDTNMLIFAVVQWVPGAPAHWRWAMWVLPATALQAARREGAEVAYRLRHAFMRLERLDYAWDAIRNALATPAQPGTVGDGPYFSSGPREGNTLPCHAHGMMREVVAVAREHGFALREEAAAQQPRLNPPPVDGSRILLAWVPEVRPLILVEAGLLAAFGTSILMLRGSTAPFGMLVLTPLLVAMGSTLLRQHVAGLYVQRWHDGRMPRARDGWVLDGVRLAMRWAPLAIYLFAV